MIYEVVPASLADGEFLLELIESTPAQGNIELFYTRRPNVLTSYLRESDRVSLGIIRDAQGRPGCMEACIWRKFYLNGKPAVVGYVSGVRKREGFGIRCNWLKLMIAYESDHCDTWIFSILKDNPKALAFFDKRRPYMPELVRLCDYTTYLINPHSLKPVSEKGFNFRPVETSDLPEVLSFLEKEGRNYDFFPVVHDLQRSFSGLELSDCYVLVQHNRIVAFGALWNQCEHKQYIVKAYHGLMKGLSKISHLTERLGYIPMPRAGTVLNFPTLTLMVSRAGDPVLYDLLLRSLAAEASKRGYHMIVAGISRNNRHDATYRKLKNLHFDSQIWLVQTRTNPGQLPSADREYHLECGWL